MHEYVKPKLLHLKPIPKSSLQLRICKVAKYGHPEYFSSNFEFEKLELCRNRETGTSRVLFQLVGPKIKFLLYFFFFCVSFWNFSPENVADNWTRLRIFNCMEKMFIIALETHIRIMQGNISQIHCFVLNNDFSLTH